MMREYRVKNHLKISGRLLDIIIICGSAVDSACPENHVFPFSLREVCTLICGKITSNPITSPLAPGMHRVEIPKFKSTGPQTNFLAILSVDFSFIFWGTHSYIWMVNGFGFLDNFPGATNPLNICLVHQRYRQTLFSFIFAVRPAFSWVNSPWRRITNTFLCW